MPSPGIVNTIEEFFRGVKDYNVAIIGETIIDEFVTVSYEGQSMKSICPVYRTEGEKVLQIGGAGAIANRLRNLVKNVDLITNTNNEIIKTRFLDKNDNKKHVEINKFETKKFFPIKLDTSKYDIVIVADFGHGFCDNLSIADGFHLMCQTNSNNFGFNRISKWKQFNKKSVCLDLREASLQMNMKVKFQSDEQLKALYNYEIASENLFLTLGSEGAIYTDGKNIVRQESFESEIIDTIGAGDTFFAFACLASQLNVENKQNIMLVPALAASLSTTWLCNEKSVTKNSLIKHANRFN